VHCVKFKHTGFETLHFGDLATHAYLNFFLHFKVSSIFINKIPLVLNFHRWGRMV
jgi:hypothetical protein